MSDRPNVLLVVIDQFRADLLDGVLAETAGLKNLTALAEQCCAFRRHYSVVTPCGPSRVSLFTSQYAMNHRAVRNGTPLRDDTPNLPREMRKAGYDPLLFGYTDVTQDPRALESDDPRLASYEELLSGFSEALRQRSESDDSTWREHLRAKGYTVPDGMDLYVPDGETIDSPARYGADDSDTAFVTDYFLDRIAGEAPGWFATLTYIRPHPPLVAPAPYNQMYAATEVPAPVQSEDNLEHPYVQALRKAYPASSTVKGFPDLEDSPDTINTLRAIYLGLCAEIDHHIGRVIDWLKSSGQWDNTILVVTADHGEMLGDFGLWGKNSFHDASFHVPLLIRAPGVEPGIVEAMTESIDVAPTILDLLGRDCPDSFNGTSLRSILEQGTGGKTVTFSEHDFANPVVPTRLQRALGLPAAESNFAVLRTDRSTLVHFAGSLPQIAFDTTAEGERRDVSRLPAGESICRDLTSKMLSHRMLNPESTFASTMVMDGGVRKAPS